MRIGVGRESAPLSPFLLDQGVEAGVDPLLQFEQFDGLGGGQRRWVPVLRLEFSEAHEVALGADHVEGDGLEVRDHFKASLGSRSGLGAEQLSNGVTRTALADCT